MKPVEETFHRQLKRTIGWKQGLASALGAPILILPSIGYFAGIIGPFAIIVWMVSVIQGTLQNVAYAELATMYPEASGLPGYAQAVFCYQDSEDKCGRPGLLSFAGGLSAWGYLIGWSFVLSIFALQIGTYLQKLIPTLGNIQEVYLSLAAGAVVFSLVLIVNFRGLGNSSRLAYILAAISLTPLLIITVSPLLTGSFNMDNITSNWLPQGWTWDPLHIMLLFGIFGMAEWSACSSEAAAVYGPEYKKPGTDLPKALFSCGLICIVTYSIVQASTTAALGTSGILAERLSPLFPLARASLGQIGVYVTIAMLIAAMILLIQMSSLTASRAMHSLSLQGNLPGIFARTNRHGTPILAMITIIVVNELLVLLRSPEIILAASSFGYMLAHGITLFSYVKARRDPRLAGLPRTYRAPRGWAFVAMFYGIFTLPFCFAGLIFLNSRNLGWGPTVLGLASLAAYLPLWLCSRRSPK